METELIEAIRENTREVRKLNELLAPELRKSAAVRNAKRRDEELEAALKHSLARIQHPD